MENENYVVNGTAEVTEKKGNNLVKCGLIAAGIVGSILLVKKVIKPAVEKFRAGKSEEEAIDVEASED